jgi:multiple sugar transport system permease protein
MPNPPGWLSDPALALYSVGGIVAWQAVGTCVVLYLAGLQSVPKELLEAAAIDGAGPVRRFWTITWPMLAPSVTIMTVLSMIGGFKIYDQVKVMTNGGPGVGTTSTLSFDVIQTGIDSGAIGYGAAKAAVMFLIIAAISLLSIRLMRKREVDL